jgi:polyhydroxybutyrate depolymerase
MGSATFCHRAAAAALIVVLSTAGAACERWARPMPGTSERHVVVGGVTRTYLLHAGGETKPGRPLVLVLHGSRMNAAAMQQRTTGTFDRLADRDSAVVVYPEALGDPRWSDGWWGSPGGTSTDDVGFLSALIDVLVAELGVDRKRVFAAGLSNGAAMVYRLACERPDLVAAVAPIAGGMPPHVARACATGTPVSVIGMHGTDDPIVPFDQSIRDGIAAWAKRDGCPAQPTSARLADTDPGDGTQTRADVFAPCAGGTEVTFYTIEGGGHAWPGGASPLAFVRRGTTPHDFDAAAVIWEFFHKHARR